MDVYLSLGSNLGPREQTIQSALVLLQEQVGAMLRCSSYYYSAPWGFSSEHEFCNICACFDTELEPLALLHTTQAIERQLGRKRPSPTPPSPDTHAPAYTDRPIDIDIILYGDICMQTPELTIPHPLYQQRDFVLIPLQEILTTCW